MEEVNLQEFGCTSRDAGLHAPVFSLHRPSMQAALLTVSAEAGVHLQQDFVAGAFWGSTIIGDVLCGRERRCRQVRLRNSLLLLPLQDLEHGCAPPRPGCPCCPAKICNISLDRLKLTVQAVCEILQYQLSLVTTCAAVPGSCFVTHMRRKRKGGSAILPSKQLPPSKCSSYMKGTPHISDW